jgi:hypothetical protein
MCTTVSSIAARFSFAVFPECKWIRCRGDRISNGIPDFRFQFSFAKLLSPNAFG